MAQGGGVQQKYSRLISYLGKQRAADRLARLELSDMVAIADQQEALQGKFSTPEGMYLIDPFLRSAIVKKGNPYSQDDLTTLATKLYQKYDQIKVKVGDEVAPRNMGGMVVSYEEVAGIVKILTQREIEENKGNIILAKAYLQNQQILENRGIAKGDFYSAAWQYMIQQEAAKTKGPTMPKPRSRGRKAPYTGKPANPRTGRAKYSRRQAESDTDTTANSGVAALRERRRKSRNRVLGGTAVVVLLAGVVGAYMLSRNNKEDPENNQGTIPAAQSDIPASASGNQPPKKAENNESASAPNPPKEKPVVVPPEPDKAKEKIIVPPVTPEKVAYASRTGPLVVDLFIKYKNFDTLLSDGTFDLNSKRVEYKSLEDMAMGRGEKMDIRTRVRINNEKMNDHELTADINAIIKHMKISTVDSITNLRNKIEEGITYMEGITYSTDEETAKKEREVVEGMLSTLRKRKDDLPSDLLDAYRKAEEKLEENSPYPEEEGVLYVIVENVAKKLETYRELFGVLKNIESIKEENKKKREEGAFGEMSDEELITYFGLEEFRIQTENALDILTI